MRLMMGEQDVPATNRDGASLGGAQEAVLKPIAPPGQETASARRPPGNVGLGLYGE